MQGENEGQLTTKGAALIGFAVSVVMAVLTIFVSSVERATLVAFLPLPLTLLVIMIVSRALNERYLNVLNANIKTALNDRNLIVTSVIPENSSFASKSSLALAARVQSALSALHADNLMLDRLTTTDALTGIGNRRSFDIEFEAALADSGRSSRPFSMVMIDLDGFKQINDTMGHAAGDMVLKEVACRLLYVVRKSDVVTRLGGDEFAIIMPDTKKEMGVLVANKICEALRNEVFYTGDAGRASLTGSISVVSFPDDGRTKEAIFETLDTVLYQAKGGGKDRVRYNPKVVERKLVDASYLALATQDRLISAFLQPVVAREGGQVFAYNAAPRVQLDGEVVALELDLYDVNSVREVLLQVVQDACAKLKLTGFGCGDAKLIVRVPLPFLLDVQWMARFDDLILGQMECHRVILALTDKELSAHMDRAHEVMSKLSARGVLFMVDDIVPAASTHDFVVQLPISFVRIRGRDIEVGESVLQGLRDAGIKTMAKLDAVSTEAHDVDYVQGLHYGSSMESIVARMERSLGMLNG